MTLGCVNLGGALSLGDATWINPNAAPVTPPKQTALQVAAYGLGPMVKATAKPSASVAIATYAPPVSGSRIVKTGTPLDNGGCGPEPPRKAANASGAAQFEDGHAGNAWLACLDRVAAEKAARQSGASAPPPVPSPPPVLVPANPAVPGAVPQSSAPPLPLPPAVSSGGGGGASSDYDPTPQQTQQTPAPTSSPAGTSTGLVLGAAALAIATGVGLYFALR